MNRFLYILKPAFVLSCFVFVSLCVTEIIIANSMVSLGKEVKTINDELDTLQYQNEALEKKIASASSLVSIKARASELGFVERSTVIHLGQEPLSSRLGSLR